MARTEVDIQVARGWESHEGASRLRRWHLKGIRLACLVVHSSRFGRNPREHKAPDISARPLAYFWWVLRDSNARPMAAMKRRWRKEQNRKRLPPIPGGAYDHHRFP
jgi:hypothetical protein